ncbi:MAG: long-chain fatty acid--CoA ligase [Bacteroidetes bacterium]|nr:long-chain fatty acid--CoA ligase [Bacteroidota bacterium]MBT3422504.1 long-chain fatty acid--CoA ligase [Bacteroidota bacterium]MBT3801066.1 long-chain fatty acid--CoA ligase [Bacteroidota bacterium]MBT4337659.1 long-chain fatty acid--CoA ligase [Bacteroidota bacterium]MBT4729033.1 long-chain fatty acid--CoA ligase [Bacteroidota bacterium]
MEIKRTFDLLEWHKQLDKPNAFGAKENGEWREYSSSEYIDFTNNISYGLWALGVEKGDKIATISNNRPEWNFVDMAISQIGAIHVPLYPNILEDEYEYILNHSESKYVFISSEIIYNKVKNSLDKSPALKDIYTFEKLNTYDKLWTEIVDLGKANPNPEKLKEIKDGIQANDMVTIIYTSGTTGQSKGVMLSHDNILSNVRAAGPLFPLDRESKVLSYLPVNHIYERMTNYVFQFLGASVYYVESMGTIVDNIQEIKPHAFTTVPRLLEKVYDRILFKGRQLTGIKKSIFDWALELGHQYQENNSGWYKFKLSIADKLVFNKWRAAFGGNVRFIASGSAALQERLARIFWAANVPVLEGYGLTETSPVISVNTFKEGGLKFGTVGPVLDNVEVKIAEDGEILTKGPHVMLGYYKAPELTKEVISEDGWFHTGDLGVLEDGKYVKITGRKKSMFKTSMGKYIVPEIMENKLRESKFIEQAIILGENEKYVGLIISPDQQYLKDWCRLEGHGWGNYINAVQNPEIRKKFQEEIDEYNKLFHPHEKIIKFDLVPHEWGVETGELTPTLKVKRNFIEKKYEKEIGKMFK